MWNVKLFSILNNIVNFQFLWFIHFVFTRIFFMCLGIWPFCNEIIYSLIIIIHMYFTHQYWVYIIWLEIRLSGEVLSYYILMRVWVLPWAGSGGEHQVGLPASADSTDHEISWSISCLFIIDNFPVIMSDFNQVSE